jgi:hypothetical protein
MTTDIPEPVPAEIEDLREVLGECVAGLPRPEAELEAAVIRSWR